MELPQQEVKLFVTRATDLPVLITIRSQDISVGVAIGYGLEGRSLIPGKVKTFLFFIASIPALGPTQLPIYRVP
jgi:hypothetical protein